jgi:putative flippase GtrA
MRRGHARVTLTRKFASFAGVGALATAAQYLILVTLVQGFNVRATVASALGFILIVGFNYFANYRWTFRSARPHSAAFPRFAFVAGVGLLLTALFMHLLTSIVGLNYLLAQLLTTAGVLVWNFFANLLWSFSSDFRTPGR